MVAVVGGPWDDRALGEGELLIGDDQLGVDLEAEAQAGAIRARAVGCVEGERPRLDLVEGERVVVGARALFGESASPIRVVSVQVDAVDDDEAIGEPQRGFNRVGEALAHALAHHEAVDDDLDRVLEFLLQLRRILQSHGLAVDDRARVSVRSELVDEVLVLAFASAHDGREDLETRPLLHGSHAIDDLLGGLGLDARAALGTVGDARARVQEAQVVVNLGDRAHRGSRVARRGLLVDGDGGCEAFDEVNVGLVHLSEELAGVGGKGLDVAALALGEDRVESQRGLARSRQPREDDHGVAGKFEVHVLQVVFPGSLDD